MNELNSFIDLDKKNDVEMLNLISITELQMKLCMFVLFCGHLHCTPREISFVFTSKVPLNEIQ